MVLLAALVTISVPGAGVPPRAGAEAALVGDTGLEWDFVTEQPGLSGLRLWLAQPAPKGAELLVRAGEAALPGIALVEAVVPLSAAGADGAVDLRFAPLRAGASPYVLTTTLQVRIEARGLAPGAGIALQSGSDPQGQGQAPAFTPLYQVRPFDSLWPISRMADGRPGIFGWPPLYALLAYGFCAFLLCALRAISRPADA
ncbi:MAG: hypothetical protein HGA45_16385 [Chloroflexales bacterium]|nr:hypothetical protein [Chloroflexales bacterium]